MSKWMKISPCAPIPGLKTSIWAVNTVGGLRLGEIRWYSRWRGYAFFPSPSTIFEQVCLREIALFCEDETRKHKERS